MGALHLRAGALDDLGELCRDRVGAHRYAVISDARVADLYAGRALESLRRAGRAAPAVGTNDLARLFTFRPGEGSKTRETWGRLADELLAAGFGRDAAVVALGGGVTGDLGGFVAATFMRGVPVVQVPTTLLAMIDASIGGKTGVNVPAAKNAIGAFHAPALVLVDPSVLGTLPGRQRAAGLSEAVKIAAVMDEDLFAWLEERAPALAAFAAAGAAGEDAGAAGEVAGEAGEDAGAGGKLDVGGDSLTDSDSAADAHALTHLIERAARLKLEVVADDPRETGRRAILNFGHTLAHALEALSGYTLLHGEAVARGMRLAASLGEDAGITLPGTGARLSALLDACGLRVVRAAGPELNDRARRFRGSGSGPETAERPLDPAGLLEAAAGDKKARGGELRWVLLERIGAAARNGQGGWTHEIPTEQCLRSMRAALLAG